ncbi:MAG: DUF2127 domain-containing protein [Acidimicrobiales bacterium]
MRVTPRRWHNETWICSLRGHVAPAAGAAGLRDARSDVALGHDMDDGTRYCRCLRCDLWERRPVPPAEAADYPVVPPLSELHLPRRGKPLEEAILLRLIAVSRGLHSAVFALLAVALFIARVRLPAIESWARSIANGLRSTTGQVGSHTFLARKLSSVATLETRDLNVLLATAVAYAAVEGVEAVFLWKERRWAEYLTVVATAGLLPFEVRELLDHVSVLRVGALVVNLAILIYLVWAKRLFGVRGGPIGHEEQIDWEEILASPLPPAGRGHTPVKT